MFSLSAPTLCISLAKPQLWWNFTDRPPAPSPEFPACTPEQWDGAEGKDHSGAHCHGNSEPHSPTPVLPIASTKLVSFFFWKKLTETNQKVMSSALYFNK